MCCDLTNPLLSDLVPIFSVVALLVVFVASLVLLVISAVTFDDCPEKEHLALYTVCANASALMMYLVMCLVGTCVGRSCRRAQICDVNEDYQLVYSGSFFIVLNLVSSALVASDAYVTSPSDTCGSTLWGTSIATTIFSVLLLFGGGCGFAIIFAVHGMYSRPRPRRHKEVAAQEYDKDGNVNDEERPNAATPLFPG